MIYDRDLINKIFQSDRSCFYHTKIQSSKIFYGKVKTMNISDEEIRRFSEDGAVVLRNVFREGRFLRDLN